MTVHGPMPCNGGDVNSTVETSHDSHVLHTLQDRSVYLFNFNLLFSTRISTASTRYIDTDKLFRWDITGRLPDDFLLSRQKLTVWCRISTAGNVGVYCLLSNADSHGSTSIDQL